MELGNDLFAPPPEADDRNVGNLRGVNLRAAGALQAIHDRDDFLAAFHFAALAAREVRKREGGAPCLAKGSAPPRDPVLRPPVISKLFVVGHWRGTHIKGLISDWRRAAAE